jgi:hypothetical protein
MIGILATPLMISCNGRSSNPVEKYHLNSAPITGQKSQEQTIIAPEVFSLTLEGTSQINNGNFIEGQEGQALVRVIIKSGKVLRYSLELTDFSQAERPVLRPTNQPDVFALSWTPPVGIIPSGTWGINLKTQLRLVVLDASDRLLLGIAKSETISLNVSRTNAQPSILGRSDLSTGIDEGQSIPFTVDIEDPGTATSPRLPELQITPYIYANTEAYRADGSRYVTLDANATANPLRRDGNKWRFFLTLQADQLPLDRDRMGHEIPSASTLDVCFHVRAVSVIGTLSAQQQICLQGRYAAQPPQIILEESNLKEVKAGVENAISLKAMTPHKMSVVSFKNGAEQISNLSGKKAIQCTHEMKDQLENTQICVLLWTPTCTKNPITRTLNLKFESTLGGKSKSSTLKREISILPNPDACPAQQPATKAPPKKEGN